MKEKCDGLLCMSKNSSNFAAHFRSVVNETVSKRTLREETDIYKKTNQEKKQIYTRKQYIYGKQIIYATIRTS